MYRGVDVRDGDLVTGFNIACRDEVHLRVAIVERRSSGWVARVSNPKHIQKWLDFAHHGVPWFLFSLPGKNKERERIGLM